MADVAMPTFVFVHGASSNSFCWTPLIRLADITFQDNVEHVVAALRRVAPYGPVILVGISMGGLTLTGVGNTAPELVSRLVYLTAFCCVELPSILAYMQTPEAATRLLATIPSVGDPTSTGAARRG